MNLAIIVLYCMVALAAIAAAKTARTLPQSARHAAHWLGVAGAFAGLVLIRLTNLEEALRQALRGLVRMEGLYNDRWEFQAPLAAAVIVLGTVLIGLFVRGWPGTRSRARLFVWLSRLAVIGYLPLYGLRLVSLHAADQLLYAGPLRLNWLIDGGLSMLALGSAVLFSLHIRKVAAIMAAGPPDPAPVYRRPGGHRPDGSS